MQRGRVAGLARHARAMVWLVVALVVIAMGLGYWWSARKGPWVDSGRLYARRVKDARRTSSQDTPGGLW